ncbi:MAG: hypothetical protein ACFE8M_02685 [Candidatus Hermodarchaeota archaeon]
MPEEKDKKSILHSNIESDLYSIINTILNLYKKYQNGILRENFFQKSIKNSMNELLEINFLINENNIILSELLDSMNFTKRYYEAIDIINRLSALNFPNSFSIKSNKELPQSQKSISSSMLELPGVTAQITSSFITLLDALKLDALDNKDIIVKLFEDLKINLNRFPGLELVQIKFENLYKYVLDNYQKFSKNKAFRDLIGDDLYKLYHEFQDKLNLKG